MLCLYSEVCGHVAEDSVSQNHGAEAKPHLSMKARDLEENAVSPLPREKMTSTYFRIRWRSLLSQRLYQLWSHHAYYNTSKTALLSDLGKTQPHLNRINSPCKILWTNSAHDLSRFPKDWINSTHDSSDFPRNRFHSTHDSSEKHAILNQLRIQAILSCTPIGCIILHLNALFEANSIQIVACSIIIMLYSTYDSRSFPDKWIDLTHNTSACFRN